MKTISKKRNIIGLFPGRFQLPHKGHKYVYDKLSQITDKTYIVMSEAISKDIENNPFTIHDRIKLFKYIGIPKEKIITVVGGPYNSYNIINSSLITNINTILLYVIGEKDEDRLTGGSYFEKLHSDFDKINNFKDLPSIKKNIQECCYTWKHKAYYIVMPNYYSYIKQTEQEKVMCATNLRSMYKQHTNTPELEEKFIKGLYTFKNKKDIKVIRDILNSKLK